MTEDDIDTYVYTAEKTIEGYLPITAADGVYLELRQIILPNSNEDPTRVSMTTHSLSANRVMCAYPGLKRSQSKAKYISDTTRLTILPSVANGVRSVYVLPNRIRLPVATPDLLYLLETTSTS
jgi:hypothetical protein